MSTPQYEVPAAVQGGHCPSFDDLYRAAKGQDITDRERARLYALPQDERNLVVQQWVAETRGGFACEDRQGADGVTYTAFWIV